MATNSVRRLFIDAAREQQHRVAGAVTSNSPACACTAWASPSPSSSSASFSQPPITMMARFVKEDAKQPGQGGWGGKSS